MFRKARLGRDLILQIAHGNGRRDGVGVAPYFTNTSRRPWTFKVDLDDVIEVSEGDLEYWLRQQGAPPPDLIERQLMPRPQWKQVSARKAIAELWPNDIPEDLVDGQIEQRWASA